MKEIQEFIDGLNTQYLKLHKNYETQFWTLYMGDKTVGKKKEKALEALDNFRSDRRLRDKTFGLIKKSNKNLQARLQTWVDFFDQYQMSEEAKILKNEISVLETLIENKRSTREEGYINPTTNKFVKASTLKMRTLMQTHPDEMIRKACYEAREKLAYDCLQEYTDLVKLRNKFAKLQGYEDFYDYKLQVVDKMTKNELFSLFEDISDKTKGIFVKIRELEKTLAGLRQPWNFGYFMSGDFTKEEDSYFQFDEALDRWGRSYSALGINFNGGKLQLDLLDREGKYNNGFCHWPNLVHFKADKRIAGSANFTCTVVAGQIGSGIIGYNTLFHEGGHAAHFLNVEQKDVCLNHEYAPMTAAWAETHSMFIDTMFDSIEWKRRYAKNQAGEAYPFELFERKVKKLNLLEPMRILSIIFVSTFEREVYELKEPTPEKILKIARKNHKKFYDMKSESLSALNVPHIYAWESSCSYHGYGLAEIALNQWREYFYKKYGYIVDNQNVGKEMKKTWQWGASKSFKESVRLATGKNISSKALIKEITMTPKQSIKEARKRLKRMEAVKEFDKPVDLKAEIKMVHGKKTIATNKNGFAAMMLKYGQWVRQQSAKN